jgi:hypothetical protein
MLDATDGHLRRGDDRLVLRPPRKNAVMMGMTALIPAVLLGSLAVGAWERGTVGFAGFLTGIVATALVALVAAYGFASALRTHLVVRDAGIERVGVLRRRFIEWGSVAKLAFNPAHHWFVVTAADGSHFWLSADVDGMTDFAVVALRRLPAAVLAAADPMVREVLEELAGAPASPR